MKQNTQIFKITRNTRLDWFATYKPVVINTLTQWQQRYPEVIDSTPEKVGKFLKIMDDYTYKLANS